MQFPVTHTRINNTTGAHQCKSSGLKGVRSHLLLSVSMQGVTARAAAVLVLFAAVAGAGFVAADLGGGAYDGFAATRMCAAGNT